MENRVERGTKKERNETDGEKDSSCEIGITNLANRVCHGRSGFVSSHDKHVIFAGAMERLNESVYVALIITRVPSLILDVTLL